jgi:hypothetical protein
MTESELRTRRRLLAARSVRGLQGRRPSKRRRRESRVRGAPAAPCAKGRKHTVIDYRFTGTPGLPCAMVVRLMPRSPRRRIRLVTVIGGLKAQRSPVGLMHLRRLDTSNGCQDHTVLPSASAPFVLRAGQSLTAKPPCNQHLRDDAACVHRIPPDVRDDRETPFIRTGRQDYDSDLRSKKSGIFFAKGLDSASRNRRADLPVGLRRHRQCVSEAPDPDVMRRRSLHRLP